MKPPRLHLATSADATRAEDVLKVWREAEAKSREFARDVINGTLSMIEEAARRSAESLAETKIAGYANPGELDLLHKASRLAVDLERLRTAGARR